VARRRPRGLVGSGRPSLVRVEIVVLSGMAAASVGAARAGVWWLARVLAVILLVGQVIWWLPRWRGVREQRRLRAELAGLALQGRQVAAVLVLWAVANGCHDAAHDQEAHWCGWRHRR
jgi:hypothetical protein